MAFISPFLLVQLRNLSVFMTVVAVITKSDGQTVAIYGHFLPLGMRVNALAYLTNSLSDLHFRMYCFFFLSCI